MKILPLIASLTVLCVSTLRADLTMVQEIKQEGGPSPINMMIITKVKGDKARLDMNKEVSSIIDLNTSDTVSLFHPRKKVIKIPAATLKQFQQASSDAAGDAAPVKPTGKKETISGFACEEYETTSRGAKVYMWLTKDAPEAEKVMTKLAAMASEKDPFGSILKKQSLPGFPVKILIEVPDGSKLLSTLTSVKTDVLPETEFTVPSDYEEMAMPTR